MIKNSFVLACIIYFFNSVGNVSQGVFIKYFQRANGIGMYDIITLKCVIICLILFPFVLKNLKNFRHKLHIVILLATMYASDMLLFNSGLKSISAGTASLILLMVPLWIILFGRIILNERKFNKVNAMCITVCLFAILLTIFSEIKLEGFNRGYVFVFIDSLVIPLSLIFQKKFNDCRPVLYALWTNAVVLGIISFSMGGLNLPEINNRNIFAGFVVALFDIMECGCVYVAYQMTEVALLQPIRFIRLPLAMVLGFLLLHEKVAYVQICAGLVIVAANLFSMWYSRKYQ